VIDLRFMSVTRVEDVRRKSPLLIWKKFPFSWKKKKLSKIDKSVNCCF